MGPDLLVLLGMVALAVGIAFGLSVLVGLFLGLVPRPSALGGVPLAVPSRPEVSTIDEIEPGRGPTDAPPPGDRGHVRRAARPAGRGAP